MRGLYVVLTHPVDGRDPLRLLSPGGGVHSEGLLPGVDHPAVLSLALALLQQPHTHLLQGDDVLCPVLEVLHQDTPVHLRTTLQNTPRGGRVLTRISLNRKNCRAFTPDLQDLVRTPSAMRTRPLTARV